MITSRSWRWSEPVISIGRQRLTATRQGQRFYSFTSSSSPSSPSLRASSLRAHLARSQQLTRCRPTVEQVRAISLWGWGSSSTKEADFAKIHTPNPALGHDGQVIAQRVTPSSPSIPAVHQTSDNPPPSSLSPNTEPTPSNVTSIPPEEFNTTPVQAPPTDVLEPIDALSSTPERIGYLKEVCGIDCGWGPTSLMEMLLEHIHIYSGFTWATSIVLLAVVTRLALFALALRSSDMAVRLKALEPTVSPVRDKLQAAFKAKDQRGLLEAKAELSALKKEYKIKPGFVFLPIVLQIPIQFGGFRVLQKMAWLPVPALQKEHWLWIPDVTVGDPFYIIPMINAAILHLTIKRGGEMGSSQMRGGAMVVLSYFLPVVSFVFIAFQPGTVQLYFFTSSILAFTQARLLTNNSFRSFLGLQPVILQPNKSPSPDNANDPTTRIITGPTAGPGALKLYQPPRHPTQASTVTTTAANAATSSDPQNSKVSIIDRFVDRAKARKTEVVRAWYDMFGTTREKKDSEAQRLRELRESERYVKRLQQEEEWKREEKNRLAVRDLEEDGEEETGTGTGAGGGMKRRGRRREKR